MKNKIIFIICCWFLITLKINASEEFNFQSKFIEVTNEGNLIKADGGVIITSDNGLKITSQNSIYNKTDKILELNKDIEINDYVKDITIKGEKIIYKKKIEEINSIYQTFVNVNKNYELRGKNIIYSIKESVIYSNEDIELKDKIGNIVKLSGFKYLITTQNLSTSKLTFKDNEGNLYISENSQIDLTQDRIASKDVQIYLAEGELGQNARLKGKSLISEKNISIINNGIFTTCKINEKCPPWSIKSKKITHDKNNKTIYYDKSILQLYDIPVFYFPKFFHPDPTVKRQSGFLTPSTTSSSTVGSSIIIPYFNVIAENKDNTLSPRIFFNNDFLIQNEYRQVENRFNHITDFSIKKLSNSTKSHFFSNTKFDPNLDFDYSQIEFNLEKTSNDTYLKKNKIITNTTDSKNQNLLESFIKIDFFNEDLNFSIETSAYEDLTKEKSSDKYQYVFPSFSMTKNLNSEKIQNGNLIYNVYGSNIQKNTNISEKKLINDFKYNSNSFFSKIGTISNYEILFKNITKNGKNSSEYKNETQLENYSTFSFNSSLPMRKEFENNSAEIEPKLLLQFSPNKNNDISEFDRKISSTNLFSTNRLALEDTVEGGQSMTLGFDFDIFNNENKKKIGMNLGQVFRDKNDKKLPKKTTLHNKYSDLIGGTYLNLNENLNIEYNFSADNNLEILNYSKLDTKIKINNFITEFEFLEENNDIGSESYLSNNFEYNFENNTSLSYNTRRNRKTNLTEYYNIIYEYKNDCLVASIEYNKDYYSDRDLKPNEEIFFKISITPFAEINSPKFND